VTSAGPRAIASDPILQRLGTLRVDLLSNVFLVLAEEIRLELNVSGLVDAVDVSKRSSDAEVGANSAQRLVDFMDVGGLGIESRVVNTSVVDAIFFTASDTDFHLEPKTEGCHALEVLGACRDVVLFGLFREIEHVGREKRLLMLLEVSFIGLEHAIEPRKEFLGAVVAVENDGTVPTTSACTTSLGAE